MTMARNKRSEAKAFNSVQGRLKCRVIFERELFQQFLENLVNHEIDDLGTHWSVIREVHDDICCEQRFRRNMEEYCFIERWETPNIELLDTVVCVRVRRMRYIIWAQLARKRNVLAFGHKTRRRQEGRIGVVLLPMHQKAEVMIVRCNDSGDGAKTINGSLDAGIDGER